jgi:hypothetical protein
MLNNRFPQEVLITYSAIKTYFGMDDEKLEAFISASEVQKAVMLEEVLRHE